MSLTKISKKFKFNSAAVELIVCKQTKALWSTALKKNKKGFT